MGVIGVGTGIDWPISQDTGQSFSNKASPIPDTDKRSDAEVINDLIAFALACEAELGNDPSGSEATVKARFDALGSLAALNTINNSNWSGADLTVPNGGMGASSFTDGGLLLGSGVGAITALGVAANGEIPIGDGATDPVLATITGTANEIDITNGAGSITVGLPANITVAGTLIANNANHVVEGLSTGRSVLRSILLKVQPGATPGTDINVASAGLSRDFNPPTITDGTNIAKSGSNGSFALNAAGTVITMDITEDIIGILGASIRIHDINSSSTTEVYFADAFSTGNNLGIAPVKRGANAQVDWTTIMDAGDEVNIYISFVTSS